MDNILYVFVQNDIDKANILENTMFADLIDGKRNTVVIRENSKDILLDLLARRKVQRILGIAINWFMGKRYCLGRLLAKQANTYSHIYVLFLNTSFTTVRYPAKVLRSYQKKWPNIKYILYYPDAVCRGVSAYANYLREQDVFDLVYSFDVEDSKRYGMIFWNTPYSVKEEYLQIAVKEDLYFVGVGCERFSILCDIAKCGKYAGLKLHMDVVHELPPGNVQNIPDNIAIHSYENVIPYYQSLQNTLKARCIIEIARPGQAGLTLRAYEAVVYNRKLLTNNKTILSFSFYDPRFMQYFEKVEDIDWDWVKEDIEVDYHYNGEFSPLRLMEDIIKACEEQENR